MNINTLFVLFAAAWLLSTALTLAGARLVLALQERRLRARGCRCEGTLFIAYRRSDCPVHGWPIEEDAWLLRRRLQNNVPDPSTPARPRRPYQAPRVVNADGLERRQLVWKKRRRAA